MRLEIFLTFSEGFVVFEAHFLIKNSYKKILIKKTCMLKERMSSKREIYGTKCTGENVCR